MAAWPPSPSCARGQGDIGDYVTSSIRRPHPIHSVVAILPDGRPVYIHPDIVVHRRDPLPDRAGERLRSSVPAVRVRIPHVGPVRIRDVVGVDVHEVTRAVEL